MRSKNVVKIITRLFDESDRIMLANIHIRHHEGNFCISIKK